MNDSFEIEYKDIMSGEVLNYKTSSEFIADKLVSNILSFSHKNKIPLWKTKLKIIKKRHNHMQCLFTIDSLNECLVSFKLYYN